MPTRLSAAAVTAAIITSAVTVAPRPAAADLTAIDEFVGDRSESWESFPAGQVPDGSHEILGGAADIRFVGGERNYLFVYRDGEWGLGDGVRAGVADGKKGLALDGEQPDMAEITFDDPVARFGAYWAGSYARGLDFRFFDARDDLIDEVHVAYDGQRENGVLIWHGWESSEPIARVEWSGDFSVNDAMQIGFVPGPATLVLLIAAGLGRPRRRARSALPRRPVRSA